MLTHKKARHWGTTAKQLNQAIVGEDCGAIFLGCVHEFQTLPFVIQSCHVLLRYPFFPLLLAAAMIQPGAPPVPSSNAIARIQHRHLLCHPLHTAPIHSAPHSRLLLALWTRFQLIWLVKTATDFESLVPRRKGMDFYRASNSQSWERLWKALYVEDGTTMTEFPTWTLPVISTATFENAHHCMFSFNTI
jgi:hypothetical protein